MKTASPIRALVLLLLVAAAVYGGSVTYTATPIPSTVTDWGGSLVVPKFDPINGNLTGIVITLSGVLDGTGSLENKATVETGTANGTLDLSATILATLPNLAVLSNVIGSSYGYTLQAGSSVANFAFTQATNDATANPAAADFYLYTGTGTLVIPVAATGSWNLHNTGGEVTAGAASFASAGFTIRYDFTSESETPEPATFVLIGLPLIALGFMARKKLHRS